MQNTSKINTILLVILIVIVGIGIWKFSDKQEVVQENTSPTVGDVTPKTDIPTSTQPKPTPTVKTTSAGSGWPTGWVQWEDIIQGQKVTKKGPSVSGEDYIVTAPFSVRSSFPADAKCVGDSEIVTCSVGDDIVVNAAFDAWEDFY